MCFPAFPSLTFSTARSQLVPKMVHQQNGLMKKPQSNGEQSADLLEMRAHCVAGGYGPIMMLHTNGFLP